MKAAIFMMLVLLSFGAYALDLSLMTGKCDGSNDYCPKQIGKAEIGHNVLEKNRHAIRVEVEHLSGIGLDDHGSNFFLIGYQYEFGGNRPCR